jgi:hypothetical protein
MNFRWHQIALCSTALLLVAAVIAGCVTHNKPSDTDWEFDRPEGGQRQNSIASQIGDAAAVFYQCSGQWPVSMREIRSAKCQDPAMRRQISNYLAAIPPGSVTNVAFKTAPDGRLLISVGFASRTVSTNGDTITYGGENITEVLDVRLEIGVLTAAKRPHVNSRR